MKKIFAKKAIQTLLIVSILVIIILILPILNRHRSPDFKKILKKFYKDEYLVQNLKSNIKDFEKLIIMFKDDRKKKENKLFSISLNVPELANNFITKVRFQKYKHLMKNLSIRSIDSSVNNIQILFEVDYYSLLHAEIYKGYIFSKKKLDSKRIVDNLDTYESDIPYNKNFEVYKFIQKNWYLYIGYYYSDMPDFLD